jgi:hypothetical protein
MTPCSGMQYTSSGTPRAFPQVKKQVVPMYCISSASERKHEIACTSWSSCLWKLCELVSNVEEEPCIVFIYTGTPISSPVIQRYVHLKCFCFVYDVWTTDLGFCQLWAINRGSHENKPNTPITDHEKKWWKREKIMYAWQWKGEWGSDELSMFLTLPWKIC